MSEFKLTTHRELRINDKIILRRSGTVNLDFTRYWAFGLWYSCMNFSHFLQPHKGFLLVSEHKNWGKKKF